MVTTEIKDLLEDTEQTLWDLGQRIKDLNAQGIDVRINLDIAETEAQHFLIFRKNQGFELSMKAKIDL